MKEFRIVCGISFDRIGKCASWVILVLHPDRERESDVYVEYTNNYNYHGCIYLTYHFDIKFSEENISEKIKRLSDVDFDEYFENLQMNVVVSESLGRLKNNIVAKICTGIEMSIMNEFETNLI